MPATKEAKFIRIELDMPEHRRIRLAAASKDKNMALFVRESALRAADVEVEKLASKEVSAGANQRKGRGAKTTVRPQV
jgi:Tfp pilus assembly protein PilX